MITYNDEPIHYCLPIMRRLSEKNVRQRKMWSYVVLFVIKWSIVRFIQLIRHEHYFFEQWWVHFPLHNSYRTPNSVEYFPTVYCNQFWFPTKYIGKVLIPILFYDNLPTKSYMTCLLLSAWTADKHTRRLKKSFQTTNLYVLVSGGVHGSQLIKYREWGLGKAKDIASYDV